MSVTVSWRGFVLSVLMMALAITARSVSGAHAEGALEPASSTLACESLESARSAASGRRLVCAEIAAFDQILVYNRFGSFNPFGMIFALKRDLVGVDGGGIKSGNVRLADGKRPRPMVLRANAGDVLLLRVHNLLSEGQPGLSGSFCKNDGVAGDKQRETIRKAVSVGGKEVVDHGEALCETGSKSEQPENTNSTNLDWPKTRGLAFSIDGLVAVAGRFGTKGEDSADALKMCRGLVAIEPGASVDCQFDVDREGTYFLASDAAPAGGEGNGGSITHGLFGAVVAEQRHTRWYRSQVSADVFEKAWPKADPKAGGPRHARQGEIDYESKAEDTKDASGQVVPGLPYLNIARPADGVTSQSDFGRAKKIEIVHSDLNAIIFRPAGTYSPEDPENKGPAVHTATMGKEGREACDAGLPPKHQAEFCEVKFREFSVFFHDELKTFYTRNFEELGKFGQFAGVRDGFGINYGSSGMGAALLANRKNIGPAADCAECLYEEFFLTSWANGDPALLESYSDDPSNVHHSYLNDPVTFRNFHAGPKETHVFHLHAHQWFAGNDPGRGSYLDSQTVAPRQGFTYDIYHGGLNSYAPGQNPSGKGWWESMGSGNRNRTIGDSIFHCHLYPHFAQGMWELWRVHDVLEDGTRRLADGQAAPGLSLAERKLTDIKRRPGSVEPWTGAWVAPDAGEENKVGTPVPALVPLPNQPLPLLPTYNGETTLSVAQNASPPAADAAQPTVATMPGYPFTIAGRPGHRPPQAPMDIARKRKGDSANPDAATVTDGDSLTAEYLDAGLPRHVVRDGAKREFGIGELPAELKQEGGLPLSQQVAQNGELLNPGEITPSWESQERKRELAWSQVAAKMLALGDMTAHLKKATLELLPYDGTPLERAAMGFHFDGLAWGAKATGPQNQVTVLELRKANGTPAGRPAIGAYQSLRSPALGSFFPATDVFAVNGAPPKPGAPFADPCGGQAGSGAAAKADPLVAGIDGPTMFSHDVGLSGFRRFEASAVQLDLVTNRAGWHDPQARIAVLTSDSDRFKDGKQESFPKASISPLISAREEPFFFRALSGECIEFRHTNELPKETELDDFQVKTPTDTIGQHIHLVKFDVTSSDGSGNGFNYEDGTFAPDEVASRICAAKSADETSVVSSRDDGALKILDDGVCKETSNGSKIYEPGNKSWWRAKRSTSRSRFQTTVQRWFADPILSNDGNGNKVDRTMRTVFSHDHFGPSSIQQHGYYTALVIEPAGSQWTSPDGLVKSDKRVAGDLSLFNGKDADIGTRKRVIDAADQKTHPDFREFAIAIADFATLYDPRDRKKRSEIFPGSDWSSYGERRPREAGMATLACEMNFSREPTELEKFCGSEMKKDAKGWFADENVPPAWHAAGREGDDHKSRYLELVSPALTGRLAEHLLRYRLAAAKHKLPNDAPFPPLTDLPNSSDYASPVAPPERPESISVDHHDPYLVNYRGEPIPLRVGTKSPGGTAESACRLKPLGQQHLRPFRAGSNLAEPTVPVALEAFTKAEAIADYGECSVEYQRTDQQGDMAGVFSSLLHFDPATPILETYSGERNIIRMIQGAQEVQHTFNIEGVVWRRNIDQSFPAMGRQLDSIWRGDWPYGVKAWSTLHQRCQEFGAARQGRPREYAKWSTRGWQAFPDNSPEQNFWRDYTHRIAECDNQEGIVTAQEIGISEHFEFGGAARGGSNLGLPTATDTNVGQVTSPSGEVASGDYIFDLGSHDAFWNGAWGLLRVFPINPTAPKTDGKAEDATACLIQRSLDMKDLDYKQFCSQGDMRMPVGRLSRRLMPLPPKEDTSPVFGTYDKPSTPETAGSISCPSNARHVYALAVARNDNDRKYGKWLSDPDGLQFTLLDPNIVLATASKRAGFIERFTPGGRQPFDGDLSSLSEPVGSLKPRDRPFVLRVRAGDCVHLAVVNSLSADMTIKDRPTLSDRIGDARMPPITPLNVDPAWEETTRKNCRAGDAACLNQPVTWIADLSQNEIDRNKRQLRPSANVSLRLPLMTLTPNRLLSIPFGVNQSEPLRSVQAGPQVAEYITFYAGRGALPELSEEDKDELALALAVDIGEKNNLRVDPNLVLRRTAISDKAAFTVDGTSYAFVPRELTEPVSISKYLNEVSENTTKNDPTKKAIDQYIGQTPVAKTDPRSAENEIKEIRSKKYSKPAMQSAIAKLDPYIANFRLDDSADSASIAPTIESAADHAGDQNTTFNKMVGGNISRLGCDLKGATGAGGALVEQVATCIPYAFGALPIKSFGDVIGHGSHGLLGALVVEPANWHSIHGDQQELPIDIESLGQVGKTVDAVGASPIWLTPGEQEQSLDASGFHPGTSFSAVFEGGTHRVREHVVFWRDGMNLWDSASKDEWKDNKGGSLTEIPAGKGGPVADCRVCTDSYDFGEKGVNYQSAPFNIRLRAEGQQMNGALESHYDLNAFTFPSGFYLNRNPSSGHGGARTEEGVDSKPAMPILRAEAGEEVVIRVLHPSGRARQRAFVTTALDYDDLFPGFGFPHSALLAPGKGITASIARPVKAGCYLWQDGPTPLRAGGTWGLLDVVAPGKIKDGRVSHCGRASK